MSRRLRTRGGDGRRRIWRATGARLGVEPTVAMLGLALLVAFGCGDAAGGDPHAPEAQDGKAPAATVVLAAPGRVEGVTEVIEVGASIDGVLAAVPVCEGDHVAAGDLLARLVCDDLEAAVTARRAEAQAAREARRRLLRGSRDEERRVAAAATAAARARLDRARQRHARLSRLAAEGSIISDEDVDEARCNLAVAEADLEAATESERLVNAPPLPEEVARADARVAASAGRVREDAARLARCRITAPIDGIVLRRHKQPGEPISVAFPQPIVSLADTSRLRVRAEVDERDIRLVRPGQPVRVTAAALGQDALAGRVHRIAAMMGRKTVRTGDPAEKSDRDVLEVLVDLEDDDPRLVVDLRVTAHFLAEADAAGDSGERP